jgi:hypothetical protein
MGPDKDVEYRLVPPDSLQGGNRGMYFGSCNTWWRSDERRRRQRIDDTHHGTAVRAGIRGCRGLRGCFVGATRHRVFNHSRSGPSQVAKAVGSSSSALSPKNRNCPCRWSCVSASRKRRRNNHESTRTDRKNPERQATQRSPSGDRPPPGTMPWMCG